MREPPEPESPERAVVDLFDEDETPGTDKAAEELAFTEGSEAYRDGAALSACPYAEGDPRRIDWEGGYMAAEDEDEEEEP